MRKVKVKSFVSYIDYSTVDEDTKELDRRINKWLKKEKIQPNQIVNITQSSNVWIDSKKVLTISVWYSVSS